MSLRMRRNMRLWLRGLFGGFIGGAANSVCAMIVDPVNFNLDQLDRLAKFALLSGAISAALWLKSHPIWDEEVEETVITTTKTVETTAKVPESAPEVAYTDIPKDHPTAKEPNGKHTT